MQPAFRFSLVVFAALLALGTARPAAAQQSVAISTSAGKCLRPVGDEVGAEIRTGDCRGAELFRQVQGSLRTAGGFCLDWINEGGPVHLAACRAERKNQKWEPLESRAIRNGLRPDLCMDVEGGDPAAGARVLAWRCQDAESPPPNQRFRFVAPTP